ncbi:hypothetical protein [Nocardia vulneris]|nr:hypothetical protein [Nocardia vulneris]
MTRTCILLPGTGFSNGNVDGISRAFMEALISRGLARQLAEVVNQEVA